MRGAATNFIASLDANTSVYDIKSRLVKRFGSSEVRPVIAFNEFKYDWKLGMKAYFDEKKRLGSIAGISENLMINFMIGDMPAIIRKSFTARTVSDLAKFYQIASEAEIDCKSEMEERKISIQSKSERFRPKQVNNKRRPPKPCFICEKRGLSNRYHWASDCYFKNNTNNKNPNLSNNTNNNSQFSKTYKRSNNINQKQTNNLN